MVFSKQVLQWPGAAGEKEVSAGRFRIPNLTVYFNASSIGCLIPEPEGRDISAPCNVIIYTVFAECSEHPLLSAQLQPVSRVPLCSDHIFL